MALFRDEWKQRGLFDPPEADWLDEWTPRGAPGGMMARPYQRGMVEGFFACWSGGHRCVLAVSATGTGKTVSASHLARVWAMRCRAYGLPPRTLFVAHREELVFQTAATMREVLPGIRIEIEMADYKVGERSKAQVVVASTATLAQVERLLRFGADDFGLLVIDEAHHAAEGNETYDRLLARFRCSKVAGITATADRTDGRSLGKTFTAVACRYHLPQAVSDGFLVPIVNRQVWIDELDLSAIQGKLKPGYLEKVMCEEKVAWKVCRPIIEIAHTRNKYPGDRQAIVFAASVDHARAMANVFNRWHAKEGTGTAAAIDCDARRMSKDERRDIIKKFKAGSIRYLTNYGVLTEGFDAPRARIVAIARLTKSRSLYEQMVGRGMRPWPGIVDALNAAASVEERRALIAGSPKPTLMLVDFAGNTGRHDFATAADIFAEAYTKQERKRAQRAITDAGRDGRAIALELELARARSKIEEEAEQAKRAGVLVGVKWSARDVDPFGALKGAVGLAQDKADRPTDRQLGYLRKQGVPNAALKKMSAPQARALLDEMSQRRARGLCSYAQARKVVRQGFPESLTFDQAREVMEALRSNGWRPLEPWVRDSLMERFGLRMAAAGGA